MNRKKYKDLRKEKKTKRHYNFLINKMIHEFFFKYTDSEKKLLT